MTREILENTTVICPKCGETNPANFRFCGMCGAVLQTGKSAAPAKPAAPKSEPPTSTPSSGDVPIALRITANPPRASEQVPFTSGPSLLGLGQTTSSGPSIDTLRDRAFSGSTPTFVYEDARPGRGRTVILLFVLLILVAGVWARYHYLGFIPHNIKPQATQNPNTNNGASANDQQGQTSTANVPPAQPATPPATTTPEKPAENAAKNSENTSKAESAPKEETANAKPDSETPAAAATPKPRSAAPAKTAKPVAMTKPAADDTGDAAFRRGDAYLYGRGASENCEEAIKNLKAASASGNAKARSAFGTMYATGHCVPRDLPTSYSWFAKALQADPNNQILEKDLTAVWNQMTPPERQLATKLKQ